MEENQNNLFPRKISLFIVLSILVVTGGIFIVFFEGKVPFLNNKNAINNSVAVNKSEVVNKRSILSNDGVAPPKLLMLGIDAADWKVVDELISMGKLPNIKKLIDNGVRATPKTLNPTISPAIWTTIATAFSPQRHGINNFISTREKDYKKQMITSESRRVKALWNIISEAGMKVGLFNFWASWPPEKINGYNVTERAMFNIKTGIYPERLSKSILLNSSKVLGFSILGKVLNPIKFPKPNHPNDAHFFEEAYEQIVILNDLFMVNSLALFKKERPDVLMQISATPDAAQHMFSKFKYPEEYNSLVGGRDGSVLVDPALIEKYGSAIDYFYIEQDNLIGEYMKLAGSDTHIIVISDHGFFVDPAVGYRVKRFNVILSKLGLLHYNDMGKINFSKTIAFECNNNTFDWQRRICINLKGKFVDGFVKQNKFEQTRKQVIKKLQTIITTNKESIFHSVVSSNKDEADVEYDIRRDIVESEIFINGKKYPFKEFLKLSVESGNHYSNPLGPDGILIWSGPGIHEGVELDTFKYIDVTPNVLHVLGLPIAKDMEGDFVKELYKQPTKPNYIASYEENPQRVYSGSHEMLENNDRFGIDKDQIYIHSSIDSMDKFDLFCFQVEQLESSLLKIQLSQTTHKSDVPYQPYDNPIINNEVELFKQKPVNQIDRFDIKSFEVDKIQFPKDSENLYMIAVPFDINEPKTLSIWTNMSFFLDLVTRGTIRLIAKGDPLNNIYPKMQFHLDKRLIGEIDIRSGEYEYYDIAVPFPGRLRISFVNDALNKKEDRNLHIQKVKFSKDGNFLPNKNIGFFLEDKDLCFFNKNQGTTEVYAKILPKQVYSEDKKTERKIIELLEETGEIAN